MKKIILDNIEKIHTTDLGEKRISKNLNIDDDPVEFCISKILKEESEVNRIGKNFYVDVDDCVITVNSSSYTIITAHLK